MASQTRRGSRFGMLAVKWDAAPCSGFWMACMEDIITNHMAAKWQKERARQQGSKVVP